MQSFLAHWKAEFEQVDAAANRPEPIKGLINSWAEALPERVRLQWDICDFVQQLVEPITQYEHFKGEWKRSKQKQNHEL